MIVNPRDLNEAYDAYTKNQLMRRDLFRCIIDEVLAVSARLKAIEDGETGRMSAAKDAAARLTSIEASLSELDDEIDTKVATAANSALNIHLAMSGEQKTPARRGRPPNSAAVEA